MIASQLAQYPIPTLLPNDKPNSIPEFVRKLFSMLEENSYPNILTWGTKRDSFIILEPNEFSKCILPKQFKHSNFASFVRQLNKYDFHKIRGQASSKLYGNQTWEFKHIYFKYNRNDLLYKIKRKPTMKSNKAKITKSDESVNIEDESSIIQKNIETLSRQLHDTQQSYLTLTSRLESMAENYQHAVETVVIFKKSLKAQDDFIQKMISTTVPTNEHIDQFKQSFQNLTKNENDKLTDIINHTKKSHQILSSPYKNISHHHCNQFTIVPSHTKWAYSPRVFLIYVNHQSSPSQLCQWFQTIGCHVHLLIVNQEENDHIMLLKTGLLIKKSFDILFFMSKGLLHSKKINLLNTIRQKDSWLPIIDVDIMDHNNDWLKHGVTEMISAFYDKSQLCDLIHKYCSHLKSNLKMQRINSYSTSPFSLPLNKKEEDILLDKPSIVNDNYANDIEEDEDDEDAKPQKRNNNGRRKIKVEYINDKSRRHITFSKRKAGIMKKAYELSALTGTQVLLIVVSETGLVYTFTTNKLQPLVTRPEGKNLIQLYLNAPDDSLPSISSFQHHLSTSWYTYNHFENIRFTSYNQVSQQGQSKSYLNW